MRGWLAILKIKSDIARLEAVRKDLAGYFPGAVVHVFSPNRGNLFEAIDYHSAVRYSNLGIYPGYALPAFIDWNGIRITKAQAGKAHPGEFADLLSLRVDELISLKKKYLANLELLRRPRPSR